MKTFKPTFWDLVILSQSIILARAVNALMDAIMVVKAPRGMDLEFLWHGAKWAWMGLLVLVGIMVWRHWAWLLFERDLKKERDILLSFLIVTGLSLAAGEFVWRMLYAELKLIDWWKFPWA